MHITWGVNTICPQITAVVGVDCWGTFTIFSWLIYLQFNHVKALWMQSLKEDQAFRDFQGTESETSKAEILRLSLYSQGHPSGTKLCIWISLNFRSASQLRSSHSYLRAVLSKHRNSKWPRIPMLPSSGGAMARWFSNVLVYLKPSEILLTYRWVHWTWGGAWVCHLQETNGVAVLVIINTTVKTVWNKFLPGHLALHGLHF